MMIRNMEPYTRQTLFLQPNAERMRPVHGKDQSESEDLPCGLQIDRLIRHPDHTPTSDQDGPIQSRLATPIFSRSDIWALSDASLHLAIV